MVIMMNTSVPAPSGISGSFECITDIQIKLKFTSLAQIWQFLKANSHYIELKYDWRLTLFATSNAS